MDYLRRTIERIEKLKIQGARRISIAGTKAFLWESRRIKSKSKKDFLERLMKIAREISRARPTEPALRNSLAHLLFILISSKETDVEKLKKLLIKNGEKFLKELEKVHEAVAEIAARRIPPNSRILTHCHSTTVVSSLKKAFEDGKRIEVVCTETRPLFQGVTTARELSEVGIPTTLIVDSAARVFMKDCNLVILGADCIASNGAVVNKIGSSQIAAVAKELRKPLLIIAGSYKFDPLTFVGYLEPIEERDPKEIIDPKRLPKVKIRNPAFDVIPPDYIDSIITEMGVCSPTQIYDLFAEKFTWCKNKKMLRILRSWI